MPTLPSGRVGLEALSQPRPGSFAGGWSAGPRHRPPNRQASPRAGQGPFPLRITPWATASLWLRPPTGMSILSSLGKGSRTVSGLGKQGRESCDPSPRLSRGGSFLPPMKPSISAFAQRLREAAPAQACPPPEQETPLEAKKQQPNAMKALHPAILLSHSKQGPGSPGERLTGSGSLSSPARLQEGPLPLDRARTTRQLVWGSLCLSQWASQPEVHPAPSLKSLAV